DGRKFGGIKKSLPSTPATKVCPPLQSQLSCVPLRKLPAPDQVMVAPSQKPVKTTEVVPAGRPAAWVRLGSKARAKSTSRNKTLVIHPQQMLVGKSAVGPDGRVFHWRLSIPDGPEY